MASRLKELYDEQQSLGQELQRESANFEKTSRARRTIRYRDKKLLTAVQIWTDFQANDDEISTTATKADENYEKYKVEIKALYQKWKAGLDAIKEPTPLDFKDDDEPELATEFKKQMVRFKTIERSLIEISEKVENGEELSTAFCRTKSKTIATLWDRISEANEDFMARVGTPPEGYVDQLEQLEELTETVMISLQNCLESTKSAGTDNKGDGIKLQRTTLPKFNGDYSKWISFRDLFKSMVMENKSLSNAQRMQLLKTNVSGEAEGLIGDLTISEANFEAAWLKLVDRYDNNKVMVYQYMGKLLAQQTIKGDAKSLKKLLDTTDQSILALKNLGRPTESWDDWIIVMINQKLSDECRRDWERKIADSKELPTWTQMKNFLKEEFRMLEGVENTHKKNNVNTHGFQGKSQFRSYQTTIDKGCAVCGQDHGLFSCDEFKSMSPTDRWELAKRTNLCFGCLRKNHDKLACKVKKPCKHCNRQHSTWLHEERTRKLRDVKTNAATKKKAEPIREDSKSTVVAVALVTKPQVLLATAMVITKDVYGRKHKLRALVDSGSQGSLITTKAAERLQFTPDQCVDAIIPLGEGPRQLQNTVTLKIWPHFESKFEVDIECYIMKKLTTTLPNEDLYIDQWDHIKGLQLADPTFNKVGPIDMLLGSDIATDIMKNGLIKGADGKPMAQQTELGWIISGRIDPTYPQKKINCMIAEIREPEEDIDLKQFWELEELHPKRKLTPDEKTCEEHYLKTHKIDTEGKYVVKIPFKEGEKAPEMLGASKKQAIARFLQLERKFKNNEKLKKDYIQVMEEYIHLGHMKLIDEKTERLYYIPHHAVLRPDSLTTKTRVVFDASARTTTGLSLNECMHVGGKTQDDLFEILTRWRKHKIVFKADIEKMYRKIKIDENDQRYHTVVWRKSAEEELKEYQLTTVTFGTAAAPYLATRTLQQIAEKVEDKNPTASEIIKNDFYVDDLISGCNSTNEAIQAKEELTKILGSHDLQLRKWTSNDPLLLATLPLELTEKALQTFDSDDTTKALGLQWNPRSDKFSFQISWHTDDVPVTKRRLLSEASKLFDPLGWLAPTVIQAKLMMQSVWAAKTGWDEQISPDVASKWQQFREELPLLGQISIDRWIHYSSAADVQLHGFCDASEQAYAAAVYTRIQFKDKVETKLIASKTRVAPLNSRTTLSRLELCGAVLLANLLKSTQEALQTKVSKIVAWSDSMITLGWLKGEPNKWKTFVANRVSEIQACQINEWRYVNTKENPADCASRGIMPSELKNHLLWWNGPKWLINDQIEWPTMETLEGAQPQEEERKVVVNIAKIQRNEFLTESSSWFKMIRQIAYCRRFKRKGKVEPVLTVQELEEAKNVMYKRCQQEAFPEEMGNLSKGLPVSKRSGLLPLTPFLDQNGVMRMKSRLQNADLTYASKCPIILPPQNETTRMIIHQMHLDTLHGGPQLMLNLLRKKYWIMQGKRETTREYRKCVKCLRCKGQIQAQLMGNLPKDRVTLERAFLHCGVDYAGPIEVRTSRLRKAAITKGYIAIFICLATKAVHLELVSDQTTQAFLAALNRFIARRGLCQRMYSDNGKNFVGGVNQLTRQETAFLSEKNMELAKLCNQKGIEWKFIPPGAPNFGGLWERNVRSFKDHLKRTVQNSKLTFEEYGTVLCQIEACLNSRPLCPLTNDEENLNALTPGHFLIGDALLAPLQPTLFDSNTNKLDRWRHLQLLQQHFWRRWHNEYLRQLQQRQKWRKLERNLKVGDLVLIKEDELPPRHWALARITQTHPGSDGLIRVVTLRTQNGTATRPISKICLLMSEEELNQDTPPQEDEPGLNEQPKNESIPHKTEQSKKETKKRINDTGPIPQNKNNTRSQPKGKTERMVNQSTQKPASSTKNTGYKLRPRMPKTFIMLIAVLGLIVAATGAVISKKPLEIQPFEHNPGIYFEDIGKVSPVKTNWHMYMYFSLSQYMYEFKRLSETVRDLGNRCKEGNEETNMNHCGDIAEVLQTELEEIKKLNILIKANGKTEIEFGKERTLQQRQKRWVPLSIVGWAAHGLFGIMAEEQAEKIEEDINLSKRNTQHLHEMLKNQTTIIDGTTTLIKNIEEDINRNYGELDRTLTKIMNDSDLTKRKERIMGFALFTSILLNRFEKTQRVILDMLTDVQQGHISSYVFTPTQLKEQLIIINNNLPTSTKLPDDAKHDLKSLYKVMRATVRVTEKSIVMEITLPLASTVEFQMYNVVPIPTMIKGVQMTILTESKYLLITLKKDSFYLMNEQEFQSCIKPRDTSYICAFLHPVYNLQSDRSKCERDLLAQEPELSQLCKFKSTKEDDFWIRLHEKNHWLYGLQEKATLNVMCQNELHTMSVEGTGILNVEPGCEIIQPGMTITAESEKGSEGTANFFPSLNLSEAVAQSGREHKLKIFNMTMDHSEQMRTIFEQIEQLKQQTLFEDVQHKTHFVTNTVTIMGILAGIGFIWYKKILIMNLLMKLWKSANERQVETAEGEVMMTRIDHSTDDKKARGTNTKNQKDDQEDDDMEHVQFGS